MKKRNVILTEIFQLSSSPEPLTDIVSTIKRVYHWSNGGANTEPYLWLTMLKVQALEAEEAFWKGDMLHFYKELADAALVVLDGFRRMGLDPIAEIKARLDENSQKNMSNRDIAYYEDKQARLQKEIAWRE